MWHCAACGEEHGSRPALERQSPCCFVFVRACELAQAMTPAELELAIAAEHERSCRRGR